MMVKLCEKMLVWMIWIDLLEDNLKVFFNFFYENIGLVNVLWVENIQVGYGKLFLVLVIFLMIGGEKLFFFGFNGVGKLILIKMILGKILVLLGISIFFLLVKISYFDQDLIWDDLIKMFL